MASYYIFGLYIVRRYYAEKQQQQQQQQQQRETFLISFLCSDGFGWSCHSKVLTMMLFGINGEA